MKQTSITLETIVLNPSVLRTKQGLAWLLNYNESANNFILPVAASTPLTDVLQRLDSDIQRFKCERMCDDVLPF